ncbi:hypothetical protein RPD_2919 [Rhodopseudomonas palustris BisB5]|uniref:Uncharacterized protein n=1 Tax=Rhodopseudomonas palustris (strain BisB5) TaxID=316057 RepID=Q135U2_RHOPS|nr:hypothetical protein RPD_2919 [Rhodopseudomonas palustris BisB5]
MHVDCRRKPRSDVMGGPSIPRERQFEWAGVPVEVASTPDARDRIDHASATAQIIVRQGDDQPVRRRRGRATPQIVGDELFVARRALAGDRIRRGRRPAHAHPAMDQDVLIVPTASPELDNLANNGFVRRDMHGCGDVDIVESQDQPLGRQPALVEHHLLPRRQQRQRPSRAAFGNEAGSIIECADEDHGGVLSARLRLTSSRSEATLVHLRGARPVRRSPPNARSFHTHRVSK